MPALAVWDRSSRTRSWMSACAFLLANACATHGTIQVGGDAQADPSPYVHREGRSLELVVAVSREREAWSGGGHDEDAWRSILRECRSEADWQFAVEGLDPLRVRSKWPIGEPFVLVVRDDMFNECFEVTVVAVANGHETVVFKDEPSLVDVGREIELDDDFGFRQIRVGPIQTGVERLDVRLSAQRTARGDQADTWNAHVSKSIELVDTMDAAVPLIPTPRLDDEVRRCISAVRYADDDGVPRYHLLAAYQDADRRMGVSLRIEVRSAAAANEVQLVPVPNALSLLHGRRCPTRVALMSVPFDLTPRSADAGLWTLHVTGTNEGLLDSWDVERAWGGEFTMPLSEAMTRYQFPK